MNLNDVVNKTEIPKKVVMDSARSMVENLFLYLIRKEAKECYPELFDNSSASIPINVELELSTNKGSTIWFVSVLSHSNKKLLLKSKFYIQVTRGMDPAIKIENEISRRIIWGIINAISIADRELIVAVYKGNVLENSTKIVETNSYSDRLRKTPEIKKYRKIESEDENVIGMGKSFALLTGIGKYKSSNLNSLPYADDDAKDFACELKKTGWSDSRIKLLANKNATKAKVQEALDGWLTKAGKNDLIVLFWSGHGFPDPEDPEKVYLACYDTDPKKPWTGYRMDRVVASLKEKGARNVIVIADTCHAGKLVTRGEKGLAVRPYMDKLRSKKQVPKGWIFMVSADADRKAIEHSSWSNGAFTYCLLKGLQGEADGFEGIGKKDGKVTMRELRVYLSSKMPDETQKVLGVAKHPLITTSSGDPKIWDLSLGSYKMSLYKSEYNSSENNQNQ
jgi:hypothetical protein